jgi:hypothetical protein
MKLDQQFQTRLSGTGAVTLKQTSTGIRTVVTSIRVVNQTSDFTTFYLYHDADGTTADETTTIAWAEVLAPGASRVFEDKGGYVLSNTSGAIIGKTSVSNSVTMTGQGYTEQNT